jgi:preprotein translocase subunit SecB
MKTVLNPDADPADPYSITMECIGVFRIDPALPEAEAKRGLLITAHSVLYGAIREAISWITARQPYGPLALGLSILSTGQTPDPATKE